MDSIIFLIIKVNKVNLVELNFESTNLYCNYVKSYVLLN